MWVAADAQGRVILASLPFEINTGRAKGVNRQSPREIKQTHRAETDTRALDVVAVSKEP